MEDLLSFNNEEINKIQELLEKLMFAEKSEKKILRGRLRDMKFYISDFTTSKKGYTVEDLKQLIKDGRIKVIEAYSNKKIEKKEIKHSQAVSKDRDSLTFKDEQYVIDLCNKILGLKAKRQYRFDFLLGDPNKDGKCVKLPVDAYYPDKNLVVEYCESQHTEEIKFFDKPDRITLSGVHRGLQRKIYDSRRLSILPQHGINVIQISYSDFACNRKNRIIRNRIVDEEIVKNKLKQFLLK